MNSSQAKKLSLPDIMNRMGYQPVSVAKNGLEYWYKSPFRNETVPSFHTSYLNGKWIWKDFGDIGGTIIDFIIRHENLSGVGEALVFLKKNYGNTLLQSSLNQNRILFSAEQKNESKVKYSSSSGATLILSQVKPLAHPSIISYITKDRLINLNIAKAYLKEIHFINSTNHKKYFALGFKNESGGYEIRNLYFKSSIGKKDLSFIKGKGKNEISVFEGYIDFLSFLTTQGKMFLKGDVLILNSVSFTQKAKAFIEKQDYNKIYTFFDNDLKGQETLLSFKELDIKLIALNYLYDEYKDYNQFLQASRNLSN